MQIAGGQRKRPAGELDAVCDVGRGQFGMTDSKTPVSPVATGGLEAGTGAGDASAVDDVNVLSLHRDGQTQVSGYFAVGSPSTR